VCVIGCRNKQQKQQNIKQNKNNSLHKIYHLSFCSMAVKRERKVEFHFFRDVIHVPTYKNNNLWYSHEEILVFANETKEEIRKEKQKRIQKIIQDDFDKFLLGSSS